MRRVAWAVVTIFVVITFNFFLFRVLPGDPAKAGVHDPRMSPETEAALRERFGLDKPVFLNFEEGESLFDSQYFIYLGQLAQGDLGVSYQYRSTPVSELLTVALGNTLWLVLPAQVIGVMMGVGLGLAAAWRRKSAIDYGAVAVALLLWSLPTFFLGLILLLFGAGALGLPTGGRATVGAEFDSAWEAFADLVAHLILPTLTLALVIFGEYVVIMRSSVLDVFSEDYILTAKAKGLTTWRIIREHALRNAMLPLVTLIALDFGFVVAGAIQTEVVFSWPGLGLLTVTAVGQKDYPVLQGTFLLIAVVVVAANLLADLAYGFLDPRVSEAQHA
ncbi:MAG TPA: ABC transporter permease [Candidatus Limnocylindria bacterium]|nr:ABC transporter permease [Candidatus Limnocylindria bacterium]